MSQAPTNKLDMIHQCRAAPDMETALEIALDGLVKDSDNRKKLTDAIFDHVKIFKSKAPNTMDGVLARLEAELVPPLFKTRVPPVTRFMKITSKARTDPE